MLELVNNLRMLAVFGIGAIAAVLVLYYARKASGLQGLISDATNRLEFGRQEYLRLQDELAATQGRADKTRAATQVLERNIEETRNRLQSLQRDSQAREAELKKTIEAQQRSLENKEAHIATMTAQLRDLEAQKKGFEIRQNVEEEKSKALVRDEARRHEAKFRQLTERNEELQQTVANLLEDVTNLRGSQTQRNENEEELKESRRKVAQYARLYQGMKSLKEMADDRNRNWEAALRKLSNWVIRSAAHRGESVPPDDAKIGVLVGEALERIGQSLLRDEVESGDMGISEDEIRAVERQLAHEGAHTGRPGSPLPRTRF